MGASAVSFQAFAPAGQQCSWEIHFYSGQDRSVSGMRPLIRESGKGKNGFAVSRRDPIQIASVCLKACMLWHCPLGTPCKPSVQMPGIPSEAQGSSFPEFLLQFKKLA